MSTTEIVQKLEERAGAAEKLLQSLKIQVGELQQIANQKGKQKEIDQLKKENDNLKKQVEEWKKRLIAAECQKGVVQVPCPSSTVNGSITTSIEKMPSNCVPANEISTNVEKSEAPAVDKNKEVKSAKKQKEKDSATKKEKGAEKKKEKPAEELPVDVGRLDFRIGQIVSVEKHPDADSLYIEKVNVGEEKPRTVISGLVQHVPLEDLQNRVVIVMCNLKPVKMRGILSEGMLMCASSPEKIEVLIPPEGSKPGDLVHFEGYPRNPDPVLNPKKKVWETVSPDLKTDENKVATYKGVPFCVPGKGVATASSLTNVLVK